MSEKKFDLKSQRGIIWREAMLNTIIEKIEDGMTTEDILMEGISQGVTRTKMVELLNEAISVRDWKFKQKNNAENTGSQKIKKLPEKPEKLNRQEEYHQNIRKRLKNEPYLELTITQVDEKENLEVSLPLLFEYINAHNFWNYNVPYVVEIIKNDYQIKDENIKKMWIERLNGSYSLQKTLKNEVDKK